MKLLSSLSRLAPLAAAAAAAFAVALPAQAGPMSLFEGQTPGAPPTVGTSLSGLPIVESTTVGDPGNFSGIAGNVRRGSDRQILLDVGVGNTVFGSFVTTAWGWDFSTDGSTDLSFAYNFVSNVAPTEAATEFFQVDLVDTVTSSITALAFLDNTQLQPLVGGPLGWGSGWNQLFVRPLAGSYSLQFTLGTSRLGCGLDGDGSGCVEPSFAVISDIPEPASLALVAAALGGALLPAATRRRRVAPEALAA